MDKKVILIARVSDVEQRKALPAQKLKLEKYAKELGLPWKYHEFDESAYKEDRHKFGQLVDNIKSLSTYSIIVFDKIDRFTRDASQSEVRIVGSLVEKGRVELHFPSDNLFITKDSPATDLFRLGIGMLLAKYYSDASRDNVKRRFSQMLNDGIWVHRAPVGYKNVLINERTKDIVIDPAKAPYVIKAFEMRATGMPYAVIAKELGKMGFTSNSKKAKAPTKSFLERTLNNKFYYGVMTQSGRDFPHKYEPLISRALFNICQKVREERKHVKTKYDSKDFALKKIVRCGKCGRAVSPFKARNSVYLRCANPKCTNPNTAVSLVMGDVVAGIKSIQVPEQWLGAVIDELRRRHDDQQIYYTHNIEQTRTEYDGIKDKLHRLYYDLLDGRITQEFHDEVAKELTRKQQELDDRLKLLTNDNKSFQLTASYLLDLARRAEQLFLESDERLQQKLLEYVLSNIELNDKKLSYTFTDPFKSIVEAKKKTLSGQNSKIWCE